MGFYSATLHNVGLYRRFFPSTNHRSYKILDFTVDKLLLSVQLLEY